MENNNEIKCTNCGSTININESLTIQIEESVRKDYSEKHNKLSRKEKEYENKVQSQNQIYLKKIQEIRIEETVKIQNKLDQENRLKDNETSNQLKLQSEELQKLRQFEAKAKRAEFEKNEAVSKAKSELEKIHLEDLKYQTNKIREESDNEKNLKIKEYEKQLEEAKRLASESKRKLEQGSVQLQGEVQEETIEDFLKKKYPLDDIVEIKKGQSGADTLQIVNTRDNSQCGSIYYESKRTKNFSSGWIGKLKKDMQEKKADFGILVTQTYPSGKHKIYQDGRVWICSFKEYEIITNILRDSIIMINNEKLIQGNKGDKKEMLYDYVTSTSFRSAIENIADYINDMFQNIEREENQSLKTFAARKAQLNFIKNNIFTVHGTFAGIAGSKLEDIQLIEPASESKIYVNEDAEIKF